MSWVDLTKRVFGTLFSVFAVFVLSIPAAAGPDQAEEGSPGIDPALFQGLKYRCIGPSRGGRATTVTGIPSQPAVFYMGTVGGGVWKTLDYGQTWRNVTDGFFTTGSIGAVRAAPSDPDIVYVGTGSDGIRSNVITGRGVYKSTNAGRTWSFLGLRSVGQIGAVEIHPGNPDIVFVAAMGDAFGPTPERGVYRTLDGGETWEHVFFLSEQTGAVDLDFAPDDPQTIYACLWRAERKPWTIISGGREGGVYISRDGGDSWAQATNGLPQGLRGKSDLAVSGADPDRLYVLMEAPSPDGGLYRSDDRGETFVQVTDNVRLLNRPFYYLNIDADPGNADVLYANTGGFYKSTDAGKSWRGRSTPHGDNHDIWINPNDPDLYIQCNDGGANVTRDGGRTWSTQHNQPTAELYQVAVDDQFPYWVYAGQQDNTTIMVPSLPPYSPAVGPTAFWRAIGGCETGPAVPKPGNHNIVYANCKGRFGRYNKLTGQEKQYYVGAANIYGHNPRDLKYRFQRVSPIHVSPHDPDVVYHASQYLHRTTDEGVTWETISPDLTANEPDKQVISGSPITRDITGEEFYSTIYAVQESPLEKGLIWVGANDGPLHVTRDGGKSWKNVSPPDLPKGGRVQTVEPSPHRPNKAYFATYRYLLGDWEPYIYRTEDYGNTWRRLTTGENGIPADTPTRVIREDPDREGLLYAGTEFGMYISFDDGTTWQPFQLNLPATPVTDIKVYRKDLVLSTMGRSFWILDNVTPLHELAAETAAAPAHLFAPRDAYRMRYRAYRSAAGDPEYPSPSVHIDYYFKEKPEEDAKLEILDAAGNIVRVYASAARTGRLRTTAGFTRLDWDMRRAAPASSSGRGGRGRAPLVVPGTYTARLTVGDWSRTVRFEILMDPRVEADGVTRADLVAQEKLCLEVMHLLARAREALASVEARLKELKAETVEGKRPPRNVSNAIAALEAVRARLTEAEGPYPQPQLINQINYLYGMLGRADQKPGRDAYLRLDELKEQLAACLTELEKAKI